MARSLAFAFQFPDPCLSGVTPASNLRKHASRPEHCAEWHILSVNSCAATHGAKKVQGWQIFHAYDIRATVHPPPLTQKRKRHACVCVCVWRWITRSHLEERGIWEGSNFRRKPLRVSREGGGGGGGIQMLIWNEDFIFLSNTSDSKPLSIFISRNKNTCPGLKLNSSEPQSQLQISLCHVPR